MLALGCDQGGFGLKAVIVKYLNEKNIEFKDFGTFSEESVDYPNYGEAVARAVLSGECDTGVIICGTGIGISIAANRFKGIRAALCHDAFSARAARQHNDANILAMGGRVIGPGSCLDILDVFLNTPFSDEERHKRRIAMLDKD